MSNHLKKHVINTDLTFHELKRHQWSYSTIDRGMKLFFFEKWISIPWDYDTYYVAWYLCIWYGLIRKVYFSINRCLKFASLGIAKELKRFSTPQGHGLFLHWKNALHYGSLILITYMYPIVSKVEAKVTAEKTYFPIYFLCEIGYVSKLPMHTFFCKKDWKFGSVKRHETERNLHIRTRRTFFEGRLHFER